ncbi:MAG: VOC family protein [Pseudomonadota bacterium]
MARLEHVNITVTDPKAYADFLCKLFGWHVRWEGPGLAGAGYTVHVGTTSEYLAVYSQGAEGEPVENYTVPGGLNHVGVVVDDLVLTEARVRELGYEPHSHADYEPGRRFYFMGPDEIEIEVVAYD